MSEEVELDEILERIGQRKQLLNALYNAGFTPEHRAKQYYKLSQDKSSMVQLRTLQTIDQLTESQPAQKIDAHHTFDTPMMTIVVKEVMKEENGTRKKPRT